jgi:hypothetical protein|tara:strand:+ start:409 stop:1029 length:621 start_codon:yes stop_codon:yes gene_type:complete
VKNLGGRPTKARQMTYEVINTAIQSTQSMSQAAIYAGVSLNTFKKYAKQHGLWAPLPSSKGIVRSVNSQFTKDIKSILEGKSPNPYREQTLLSKAIKEGYIACKCSNCSQDFTDYQMRKDPPLILDFLDKNPQNTKIENLRALCFNCVYSLYYTLKGWYRHRDTAIRQAMDAAEPQMPDESEVIEDSQSDNLTYIPFEEFQKSLKN